MHHHFYIELIWFKMQFYPMSGSNFEMLFWSCGERVAQVFNICTRSLSTFKLRSSTCSEIWDAIWGRTESRLRCLELLHNLSGLHYPLTYTNIYTNTYFYTCTYTYPYTNTNTYPYTYTYPYNLYQCLYQYLLLYLYQEQAGWDAWSCS